MPIWKDRELAREEVATEGKRGGSLAALNTRADLAHLCGPGCDHNDPIAGIQMTSEIDFGGFDALGAQTTSPSESASLAHLCGPSCNHNDPTAGIQMTSEIDFGGFDALGSIQSSQNDTHNHVAYSPPQGPLTGPANGVPTTRNTGESFYLTPPQPPASSTITPTRAADGNIAPTDRVTASPQPTTRGSSIQSSPSINARYVPDAPSLRATGRIEQGRDNPTPTPVTPATPGTERPFSAPPNRALADAKSATTESAQKNLSNAGVAPSPRSSPTSERPRQPGSAPVIAPRERTSGEPTNQLARRAQPTQQTRTIPRQTTGGLFRGWASDRATPPAALTAGRQPITRNEHAAPTRPLTTPGSESREQRVSRITYPQARFGIMPLSMDRRLAIINSALQSRPGRNAAPLSFPLDRVSRLAPYQRDPGIMRLLENLSRLSNRLGPTARARVDRILNGPISIRVHPLSRRERPLSRSAGGSPLRRDFRAEPAARGAREQSPAINHADSLVRASRADPHAVSARQGQPERGEATVRRRSLDVPERPESIQERREATRREILRGVERIIAKAGAALTNSKSDVALTQLLLSTKIMELLEEEEYEGISELRGQSRLSRSPKRSGRKKPSLSTLDAAIKERRRKRKKRLATTSTSPLTIPTGSRATSARAGQSKITSASNTGPAASLDIFQSKTDDDLPREPESE